jgi:hypothetical protein
MQDLAHWLKELGMSEYTQRFAENRIDLSVLPELTLAPQGRNCAGRPVENFRAIRELTDTFLDAKAC